MVKYVNEQIDSYHVQIDTGIRKLLRPVFYFTNTLIINKYIK